MTLEITPIYAALLTLLYLWLSYRVVQMRGSAKVSLGDGGDRILERRIRAHGNCAENAPIGLILMLMMELSGAPAVAIHGAGLLLLVGRLAHAAALSSPTPQFLLRTVGMGLTYLMQGLVAVGLLAHALI